jgi:hypothetical protein
LIKYNNNLLSIIINNFLLQRDTKDEEEETKKDKDETPAETTTPAEETITPRDADET